MFTLPKGGLALAALGSTIAITFWRHWDAVVKAADNSPATAAGGVAAASMVALMGLALLYASREQQQPAPPQPV